MNGVDAVVSLVSVLHRSPGSPLRPGISPAPTSSCPPAWLPLRAAGVRRIVHVSALGADPFGPSEYQRSKAAGEAAIRARSPEVAWTILRPSVIFGPGDSFLNLSGPHLRRFLSMPSGRCRGAVSSQFMWATWRM